jgi:HEAT repeat protein
MGKRVKITIAVLAVALVGVIGWQAWPPPEPVYEGKPLSSWLRDAKHREGGERVPMDRQTFLVVRQIGTNAIPTLLRLLRAKDSPFKLKLTDLAKRQHLIKIQYTPAEDWNRFAADAFRVLGTNAQSAAPALIRIANQNISRTSQMYAFQSLGFIGPSTSAKQAVPSLLRWATNADVIVRCGAICLLGAIHAEPDRVVPVLMNALHDTNANVRYYAGMAVAHEEFGPAARLAVPALVELLNDPNEIERGLATNALKAIDPAAAAKAGVK